jgi:hypothetical protein
LSEFGHFYHDEIGQPPIGQGPIVMHNGIGSLIPSETRLFSSEIQIYQAIHLLIN